MDFDGEIDDFDETELGGFDEFPEEGFDMMEQEEDGESIIEEAAVAASRASAKEGPLTRRLLRAAALGLGM